MVIRIRVIYLDSGEFGALPLLNDLVLPVECSLPLLVLEGEGRGVDLGQADDRGAHEGQAAGLGLDGLVALGRQVLHHQEVVVRRGGALAEVAVVHCNEIEGDGCKSQAIGCHFTLEGKA